MSGPASGDRGTGETVWTNGKPAAGQIAVCVPFYRDDPAHLAKALSGMRGAETTSLIFYDDGSDDGAITDSLKEELAGYPGAACLVIAKVNCGRAHARNRLAGLAAQDWILFLDADMQPDDGAFIDRYINAIKASGGPAVISGGFSLHHTRPSPETRLHAAQSRRSECLDAETRNKAPGLYLFTSNILVHRTVLETVPFDDGYEGWGWEDVDWGLSVVASYPLRHIDNPATHLGLDETGALLDKFGGSGRNFARLARRHPDAISQMPLYRMAKLFSHFPARGLLQRLARGGAAFTVFPVGVRLACLKTYRALAYSKDIS